jgi:glycine/D-amino acid oxidase-like deaminating enzyme
LDAKVSGQFLYKKPLYRILANAEEQNDWTIASDSPVLAPFLSSEIISGRYPQVQAPFGFGEVHNTFNIDTLALLRNYHEYLTSTHQLIKEKFDYSLLSSTAVEHQYGDYTAKHIIFAEGSSIIENPNYTYNCIIPKKGEYVVIRSTQLKCDAILKGPFFMIPRDDDHYQVGATFAHGDFTMERTEQGKTMLEKAIKKMISCDFEIVDQTIGMRPTVKDRRPVLGSIKDNGMFFFNGLGTRGLLMAPLLSQWLLDHIENKVALPSEVHIRRFEA